MRKENPWNTMYAVLELMSRGINEPVELVFLD